MDVIREQLKRKKLLNTVAVDQEAAARYSTKQRATCVTTRLNIARVFAIRT